MPRMLQALCWALAMIAVALAEVYGFVSEGMTSKMILLIPVAAIVSMSASTRGCRPRSRREV